MRCIEIRDSDRRVCLYSSSLNNRNRTPANFNLLLSGDSIFRHVGAAYSTAAAGRQCQAAYSACQNAKSAPSPLATVPTTTLLRTSSLGIAAQEEGS